MIPLYGFLEGDTIGPAGAGRGRRLDRRARAQAADAAALRVRAAIDGPVTCGLRRQAAGSAGDGARRRACSRSTASTCAGGARMSFRRVADAGEPVAGEMKGVVVDGDARCCWSTSAAASAPTRTAARTGRRAQRGHARGGRYAHVRGARCGSTTRAPGCGRQPRASALRRLRREGRGRRASGSTSTASRRRDRMSHVDASRLGGSGAAGGPRRRRRRRRDPRARTRGVEVVDRGAYLRVLVPAALRRHARGASSATGRALPAARRPRARHVLVQGRASMSRRRGLLGVSLTTAARPTGTCGRAAQSRPSTRSRRRGCIYYVGRGFEVDVPLADWYERYQQGSRWSATTGSASPIRARRRTRSTWRCSRRKETLRRRAARARSRTATTTASWTPPGCDTLERLLPPLRFLFTGCRCSPRTSARWRPAGASRSPRRCRRRTRCGAFIASRTGWRMLRRLRPGFGDVGQAAVASAIRRGSRCAS